MKDWWQQRSIRERSLLLSGGMVLLLVLSYGLFWAPFQDNLQNLRSSVEQQRSDLAWMRSVAAKVQRLQRIQTGPTATLSGGSSLLTVIDQAAKTAGFGTALKRLEPQGNGQLRVQMQRVGFDALILWLDDIAQRYGIRAVNVVIQRQEQGLVDARLVLQNQAADTLL